jgi:hypothetical protein
VHLGFCTWGTTSAHLVEVEKPAAAFVGVGHSREREDAVFFLVALEN